MKLAEKGKVTSINYHKKFSLIIFPRFMKKYLFEKGLFSLVNLFFYLLSNYKKKINKNCPLINVLF